MQAYDAASSQRPEELLDTGRLVLWRTGVTENIGEDGESVFEYTEYRMTPAEYRAVRRGTLPRGTEWDEGLHALFRQAQHERADGLVAKAYRKRRTLDDGDERDAWTAYLSELDEWSEAVSALAETLSVDVPELPTAPE